MAEDTSKKQDPRSVFVRGIDASVTNEQLQELFSEIGPVKNAFLVRRGKDGPHRGFGFVQFAVQESAAQAVAQLHGKELAGRKLRVESAVKRAPLEERKKRKLEGSAAQEQQQQQQQQSGAEQQAQAAAEPAQRPAAKKPRPAKPASKPSGAAATAAQGKHKWLRAVAVGGLTPEAVDSAVQMAKAAGEVRW
jgi:nucleolar protein 4